MKAVRNQLQQVELYEEKLQLSPAPDPNVRLVSLIHGV